jgi:hypothetical protein
MIKVWTDAAEAGILERIEAAIADTSKGTARLHGGLADNQFDIVFNRQRINSSHLQGSARPIIM